MHKGPKFSMSTDPARLLRHWVSQVNYIIRTSKDALNKVLPNYSTNQQFVAVEI